MNLDMDEVFGCSGSYLWYLTENVKKTSGQRCFNCNAKFIAWNKTDIKRKKKDKSFLECCLIRWDTCDPWALWFNSHEAEILSNYWEINLKTKTQTLFACTKHPSCPAQISKLCVFLLSPHRIIYRYTWNYPFCSCFQHLQKTQKWKHSIYPYFRRWV